MGRTVVLEYIAMTMPRNLLISGTFVSYQICPKNALYHESRGMSFLIQGTINPIRHFDAMKYNLGTLAAPTTSPMFWFAR